MCSGHLILQPVTSWEALARHRVTRWALTVQGRSIGHAALRLSDPAYADYEIEITRPADRGRGHGTATTRLLLGYAFATLGLARVRLLVEGRNRHALACYTTCGFVPVVRSRDGRHVVYTMVCPNPAPRAATSLCRALQLPVTALRGRRLQLTRADLGFLGTRPGEPVAIETAAGELLITVPDAATGHAEFEEVAVDLTEAERDRLTLVAAQLGLSPATLINELIQEAVPRL